MRSVKAKVKQRCSNGNFFSPTEIVSTADDSFSLKTPKTFSLRKKVA